MSEDYSPRWPAMEYYYGVHDFTTGERAARAEAEIKARSRDGWQVHTATHEAGVYMSALWHRPAAYGGALAQAQRRAQELEAELARVTQERDQLRASLSATVYAP